MKEISVQEFVRRFKASIEDQDSRFTFFLGAGCSITSGIPSAGELVNSWIPKLKRLKTGNDDNLNDWVKGKYPEYDNENPAQLYGTIIEDLFILREERQKEIERLIEGNDPGFGYAVLAQIMSHEKHGRHCNIVLTTNFDDMVADALYLYTSKKPLVITHESLAGFIRISGTRPIVVKLHGDARLAPKNTEVETRKLAESVKGVLKKLLAETGMIFAGYGGNDDSIVDILNELPKGALPWGCYWVGDSIPGNAMGDWLRERDAIWVKHRDFDELMLLMQSEFGFGEPDWKRFDKLTGTYAENFKSLTAKVHAKPDTAEKEILEKAVEETSKRFKSWWSVDIEASKYREVDPGKADSIYREGIEQFHNSDQLMNNYATFLRWNRKDYDRAGELYKKALELNPSNAALTGNYALFLHEIRKDYDRAEELYEKALELNPSNAIHTGNYALFFQQVKKDYDKAEGLYKKALELDPNQAHHIGNYASFLRKIRKDYDRAGEMYKKSLELEPDNATHIGNYAIFLHTCTKDYKRTEEMYKKLLELDRNHANNIGNYAGFLLSRGRLEEGAELLNEALPLAGDLKPLLLECHFYSYAHLNINNEKGDLEAIKNLIVAGELSAGWDLSSNVARAIKDGHPEPEFLKVLANVIVDEVDAKELDKFEVWKNIKIE